MHVIKPRILIADDDEAGRSLLVRTLSREGFSIVSAKNGKQALQKCHSQKPDLIITDIKMPVMDGYELASEIRRLPDFAHVPIIFVSAMFKDIASKIKGMEIGGNEHLTLPLDREELLYKVKSMLRNKQLYDELLSSQKALIANEQKYRALFENANDAIYLISADIQKILDCNAKASSLTGFTNQQLKTMYIYDLHPVEEQDVVSKIFQKVLKMGTLSGISGIHHINKEGRRIPIEINAASFVINGGTYCLGIFRDVTDRKITERTTIQTKELWEKTFDTIPDMIAVIDNDLKIVKANRAMIRKLGIKRNDLIGQICHKVLHGSDSPPSTCPHSKTLADGKEHIEEIYDENLKGYFIMSTSPLFDTRGKQIGVVEVARDITERKKLEKRLHETAITDELTGLINRRGFITIAEKQLKLANRTKRPLLLLYIDLDKMKSINDEFGHDTGDQCLRDTADVLKRSFRESDIIARIGGDEFAVLLIEHYESRSKEAVIQHLRRNLELYNKRGNHEFEITLSIGIAHYNTEKPQSITDLMRAADDSMYKDKRYHRKGSVKAEKREKREHNRYLVRSDVQAKINARIVAQVINVSLAGICLKSQKPLQKDRVHHLSIKTSSGGQIDSEAIVIRSLQHKRKTAEKKGSLHYETGMKFIGMKKAAVQSLEKFITKLDGNW